VGLSAMLHRGWQKRETSMTIREMAA
jgi:hypothetical protein